MAEQEIDKSDKMAVGIRLKEAREAQGLTLDVVHEATKIPMDVLRSMEEGYNIRILTSFYYKGFIKIYSKYLGLDPREFTTLEIGKKTEIGRSSSKKEILNAFDFQDFSSKFFTKERKRQFVVIIGLIVAVFVFIKIVGAIKHYFQTRPSKPKVVEVKVKESKPEKSKAEKASEKKKAAEKIVEKPIIQPVEKEEPKAVEEARVMESSQSEEVSSEPGVKKSIVLTVRAKKESWLSVKADGEIVFQSTLNLGAVETWMANNKIELSGRNINQLEFELNGKMIGTLGRNDRGAKGVVVTKDGLSVTK